MRVLLIDDNKNLEADRVARTFNEGIAALKEERWDLLLLDHDLADFSGPDGSERDGSHIMSFLEEYPEYLPGRIRIVSINPVGIQKIRQVIIKLYGRYTHR